MKGNRCNGCGVCCLAEQCAIGVEIFGNTQVCPALEFDQDRFWCGLMIDPGHYGAPIPSGLRELHPEAPARYYRNLISPQAGCDSEDEVEK